MLHKKPKELIFCRGQFQWQAVSIGPSLQQLERDPVGTEFSGMSDRKIGRRLGIKESLVGQWRRRARVWLRDRYSREYGKGDS